MEDISIQKARRVTREELYAMVWQKPMNRLAEEFGISGNGLAKICGRLDVPYPPRGHWAKKEAGKPVVTLALSSPRDGIPREVDIYPTQPKSESLPEAEKSAAAAASKVEGIVVPDDLDNLHPRIKSWIADHKKLQKEREQESKRHRHDSWWSTQLLPDLTERDIYRFRITSSIFKGVENAGGKIESSPISGKITFLIEGHKLECSIVEKLIRSLRSRDEIRTWTAYPNHHQSGLDSSGFLRVSITTYLRGGRPEWIETQKKKIVDMLPEITGAIIAAGPILERMKREHEEQERQYREKQAQCYEAQRLRAIDEKRWQKFREFAVNWEERGKLLAFIAEIEKRGSDEIEIAGKSWSDWIAWAKERAATLDPFREDVPGVFEALSKISQWS